VLDERCSRALECALTAASLVSSMPPPRRHVASSAARLRTAFWPYASSGVVTALAQATLFEALDRLFVVALLVVAGSTLVGATR
jgi:hypothetical protein